MIEVTNLRKVYPNGTEALKGVSFEVGEGEVFGFLGPNGAGKTTTIKILTTLTKPTSGEARIAGFDVLKQPDRVRRVIGVVFQEPALDIRLTGRENLDFHGRLYGLDGATRKRRISELLDLVDLSGEADTLVKYYSGGMKRRLEIARGLMHFPKVLFLDEPTLGLDAQTRRRIWEYIERVRDSEGITVFLTTHYIEEAEKMCRRVAVIDHGRILRTGEVRELLSREKTVIEVRTEKRIEGAKYVDGVAVIEVDGSELPAKVKELMSYGVKSINIRKPSLEDVFVELTGRKIRDGPVRKGRWRK